MEAEAWMSLADGLPLVIVNPTVVIGPWDAKPTTSQILLDVAKGRFPVWLDLKVNVVDARDVGQGHVLAARRGRSGQRYILGGTNLPLRDALTLAAREIGTRPPRWQVSPNLIKSVVSIAELLGRLPLLKPLPLEQVKTVSEWRALSTNKARRELGFEHRPYVETLCDALAWFKEYGYL
jgi:dihydroflavonol-4-reductase